MALRSILGRVATLIALTATATSALVPSPALAADEYVSASANRALEPTAPCAAPSPGQQPSPFSDYLTTALPLLAQAGVDPSSLQTAIIPLSAPPSAPVQVPTEVNESITAMRALPRVDLRWQATFLAPLGSGWLILSLPDGIDGGGLMASRAWTITTSGGQTEVQVDGSQVGTISAKGIATTVRDAMLSLPCDVPDLTVQHDGAIDHVQGRLQPGAQSGLVRQITGLTLPGSPSGQLTLAIDSRTRAWQAMEINLVWAIIDVDVFGHRITWGPGGRIALTFGSGANSLGASLRALPGPSPSAAQRGLSLIQTSPITQPVAAPAGAAYLFLDARAILAMRDQEPVLRSAISTAWQQGGVQSTDYESAVRAYRDWERRTPFVGPFLQYVFADSPSP